MRIAVIAVGKWKNGPERDLFEEYAGRLSWPVTLKEVEEHRKVPPAQLMAREGTYATLRMPSGEHRLVHAGDRRIPGWLELVEPGEEAFGIKPRGAHNAAPDHQRRE